MKKILTRYGIFFLLLILLVSLLPAMHLRLTNEARNKNITVSVLYNDLLNKLSEEKRMDMLRQYKEAGVNMVSVMEDDLNALSNRGAVTCVKYNKLLDKYDSQSRAIAAQIAENCPRAEYESYVLIASDAHVKDKLRQALPNKYSEAQYADAGSYGDLDLYVFYDGRRALWEYTLGYDEADIQFLQDMGFDISLVFKVKNHQNLAYLEEIDRMISQYGIQFMNIKADFIDYPEEKVVSENYTRIAEMIQAHDMTLVVTENTDQLSNQKSLGYGQIFEAAMKEAKSPKKVLRAYETYDDSQADETHYKYRTAQYFNSTVDRNIRFITVTLAAPASVPYAECADYTFRAVTEYKSKVEALGFTVNQPVKTMDYEENRTLICAICGAVMVLCVLLIWEMIRMRAYPRLRLYAVLLSLVAFFGAWVLPASLLSLYPSAFCLVQSCLAMTAMLYFIKKKKDTLSYPLLLLGALGILLGILFLCAICMGSLLSGIDYYINNSIFRGIKLSLIVPVLFTAILYYFMFVKPEDGNFARTVQNAFYANIRVYWVLLGGILLLVGAYYIRRSGNVNSISDIEQALRSAVTEIFPARPRTKEFLLGYPAVVLFVYYMKKDGWKLIKWLLAVASSILAASVTNSFCHVFTDFTVILSRTLNGLLVGAAVSVFVFVANLIFMRIFTWLKEKFTKWAEMK